MIEEGEIILKEALDAKWVALDALHELDWLPADRELIEKIQEIARADGEGRLGRARSQHVTGLVSQPGLKLTR